MRGGRLCWSSTPFFVFLCFIVLVVLVEGVVGIVEVPEKKQKPVWYDRGIFSFLSPLFSGSSYLLSFITFFFSSDPF